MLKFTGLGSAFNTKLGNTSAYLRSNQSLLLIDCGSTVFERARSLHLFEGVKNLVIAMTHTHPDHIGSLGEVIFYSHYKLGIKPKICFPEPNYISNILTHMGVSAGLYDLNAESTISSPSGDFGSMSISYFQTTHVSSIPAYSIILNVNGQSCCYSGDSNSISSMVLEGLTKGDIQILYQDTCGLDYEGNPHMYLGKLAQIIPQEIRNKIYCMHLDEHFDETNARNLGFNIVTASRMEDVEG